MRRFLVVVALIWTAATAGFLLFVSVLMIVQPRFPLNLGAIKTVGPSGLFVTLVPAAAAIAGLASLRSGRGSLVAAYHAFCAAVMLSGLPAVWDARRSFCIKGLDFCIYSPWVARLTVIGIAVPFILSAAVLLTLARRGRALPLRDAVHAR